jgi:hypothetical protein
MKDAGSENPLGASDEIQARIILIAAESRF